ncbi:exopolysaccharide polymerization and/or export protein [Roseobacter sp. SK209-2-6]|uniref:lipopolysaccharide biosynthesis protein n=1 Tax=Roseobacter sp. SK209-2-6 TaxID=388739 RepID=UPI0000F3F1AF|nr:lipopolysaccharide biosynthesis protein [Roseobacter sp. SK209-2-6]EBA14570.1 exopolysaccharide polymerization and/or export protein [Roseobacter sp. SK209-2-6]
MAAKLAGGALLNFISMVLIRLMGLINIAIIARLLTPDDFGLMALALIAVGFVEALINRQFENALIRQQDVTADHFNTAFCLAILVGLFGMFMVIASAGYLAQFFGNAELQAVLYGLSPVPLLMGLRNPYFVNFEKNLNFRPRLKLHVRARLVMTFTSVITAYILQSYWALVISLLTLHATFVVLTWHLAEGRPALRMPRWKAFFRFGGWLTLAGLAIFFQKRLPTAILGKLATTYEAGRFHVANEISTTMTQQLLSPIGEALFPGLMSVSKSPERLRRAYLKGQQSLLGIALPVGTGVAIAAPEVVRVLLGAQWEAAVPIIAILTPVSALSTLTLGVNAIKMIDGDTRTLFLRNLFILVLTIPLSLGGYLAFGITGLVLGQALGQLINLALTLQIAARATQSKLHDPLRVSWRSFVATPVMAATLLGIDALGGFAPFEMSLLQAASLLLGKALLGAVIAGGVQMFLWRLAGRPDGFEQQVLALVSRLITRVKPRKNHLDPSEAPH